MISEKALSEKTAVGRLIPVRFHARIRLSHVHEVEMKQTP